MRLWGKTRRAKSIKKNSGPTKATIPVAGQIPLVWLSGERKYCVELVDEMLGQLLKVYGYGLLITTDQDALEHLPSWLQGVDYCHASSDDEVIEGSRQMLEEKRMLVIETSPSNDKSEAVIKAVREVLGAVRNMLSASAEKPPFIFFYGVPSAGVTELARSFTELKVPLVCITEQHYLWRQEEDEAIDSLLRNFTCRLNAGAIEEVVLLSRPGIGLVMDIGNR